MPFVELRKMEIVSAVQIQRRRYRAA